MSIVTRPNITSTELDRQCEHIEHLGLRTSVSRSGRPAIIGCIGDVDIFRQAPLLQLPDAESVTPVMKPHRLAASEFLGAPSRVRVREEGASAMVGGSELAVIAGHGSVEGLEMLAAFRAETRLPVVTEVVDTRQFEKLAQYADVVAIPVLKRETHLSVVVDRSHAAGGASLVGALAFAAIAAGADGIVVEVHPCPEQAHSDGEQSLPLEAFDDFMQRFHPFADAAGGEISRLAPSVAVA